MKKTNIGRALIPTLLATAYTVPSLAYSGNQADMAPQPGRDQIKPAIASQAIRQEVIQLLLKEHSDFVTLNIAGQPGIRFRVYYSLTGKDKSYRIAPESEKVIGTDGTGSVGLKLGQLSQGEIYLKVKTSDKADFSETLTMAEPFVLELAPLAEDRMTSKGLGLSEEDKKKDEKGVVEKVKDKYEATIKEIKEKVQNKFETRTRVSAVAGVRG
ncbi:MAG: hypothetical protein NTZ26_11755 [Candidatus Aminicenantes bacterium]|nr:hypothetical protein [Candidatus Aminicenantes bacterium]